MTYKKPVDPSITAKLMEWRTELLDELESDEWLGARDPSFKLGGFLQSCPPDEYPHIFLNHQTCAIDIVLTEAAVQEVKIGDGTLARWQLAHECVHLIDPNFAPPTNVLEEGIASWYQDEKVPGKERSGPNRERYEKAKSYVKANMKHEAATLFQWQWDRALLKAVQTLRSEDRRIGDITQSDLIRVASFLSVGTAYQLTKRFRPLDHGSQ